MMDRPAPTSRMCTARDCNVVILQCDSDCDCFPCRFIYVTKEPSQHYKHIKTAFARNGLLCFHPVQLGAVPQFRVSKNCSVVSRKCSVVSRECFVVSRKCFVVSRGCGHTYTYIVLSVPDKESDPVTIHLRYFIFVLFCVVGVMRMHDCLLIGTIPMRAFL